MWSDGQKSDFFVDRFRSRTFRQSVGLVSDKGLIRDIHSHQIAHYALYVNDGVLGKLTGDSSGSRIPAG